MNSIIDHARDTEDYPIYPTFTDVMFAANKIERADVWDALRYLYRLDKEKIESWR